MSPQDVTQTTHQSAFRRPQPLRGKLNFPELQKMFCILSVVRQLGPDQIQDK